MSTEINNREQECIVELYSILDKIVECVTHHDFSPFRAPGAGGCDQHQGVPTVCRVFYEVSEKYSDVLSCAFKANEQHQNGKVDE